MDPLLPGWSARSLAQSQALQCVADLMLFGGAAGALKSETMLVDAIAERHRRGLRALLFRRSFPELEKGLIRRSRELYAAAGAVYNETRRRWTFQPSGATVEFAYCESDKDVYRYQGGEFTFIGFDESTHFTEFSIRYLLSRLRSTDAGMRLRLRLASNPGNIGHNTHKGLFLGDGCPHCQSGPGVRAPGVIYTDAVWPSDQRPVGRSTCFIPGRVTDHNLLGSDYIHNLESLGGAFRKALLEGCWDVYEGQYFDHWNPRTMVMERARIPADAHWAYWVGIDYGFNISQAAAYLFARSPASAEFPHGRIFVLDEYTARHETADAFARSLHERFGAGRRIAGWFLSPDCWSQRGEGHSLVDQMEAASGIAFTQATSDRIAGAMLIYTRLDRGELVLSSNCRQLTQAIPSRIHNPDRPDDILKIAGDPLDDCIDALRYGLASHIQAPQSSLETQLQSLAVNPDPTVAAIQRAVAEIRWTESHQPRRYLAFRDRGPRMR